MQRTSAVRRATKGLHRPPPIPVPTTTSGPPAHCSRSTTPRGPGAGPQIAVLPATPDLQTAMLKDHLATVLGSGAEGQPEAQVLRVLLPPVAPDPGLLLSLMYITPTLNRECCPVQTCH